MEIDNNQIVACLRKVLDPITGQDILTRRMVENLQINGNNVSFVINAPGVDTEQRTKLNFNCIEQITSVYPNANVDVHLKTQGPTNVEAGVLPHIKNIIAVASGKGGVGKSTVAVNLALSLRKKGLRVGLIDADLYGPSIPTMLGLKGQRPKVTEVHGKHKINPLYYEEMPVMSIGFVIEPEQAVILRGPRLGGIIKQFVKDCIWPPLDVLVIDLPPGTGDIQLTLVQTVPITGAVMVTTPQEVALADAVKAMNMFLLDNINVPILGVIENMAWFTPAELPDNKYYIFGEGGGKKLAQMAGTNLLGQIPIIQTIREGGDKGAPDSMEQNSATSQYFDKICDNFVESLELRNKEKSATKVVRVN